jgi:hypothetical protein
MKLQVIFDEGVFIYKLQKANLTLFRLCAILSDVRRIIYNCKKVKIWSVPWCLQRKKSSTDFGSFAEVFFLLSAPRCKTNIRKKHWVKTWHLRRLTQNERGQKNEIFVIPNVVKTLCSNLYIISNSWFVLIKKNLLLFEPTEFWYICNQTFVGQPR